jgi:hypothetical protein
VLPSYAFAQARHDAKAGCLHEGRTRTRVAVQTRAEVIKQAGGSTFVHPAAHFPLSEAEIALHQEPPRVYSWGSAGAEDNLSDDDLIEGEQDAGGGGAQPVGGEADVSADGEDGAEPEGEEEGSSSPITSSRRSRRRQAEAA